MRVPVATVKPRQAPAGGQVEQRLADTTPVEQQGFMLITETHETLVTCGLTGVLMVIALIIEMAPAKRLTRDAGQRVRLVD